MNEKLQGLKEKITGIYDSLMDFIVLQWESNRVIFLSVCALIVCIPLILIVVMGMGGSGQETVIRQATVEDYIYLPSEPEIGKDYIYSREPKAQWNDDEVHEWFEEPDGKMMNDIRKVNDKLIDELLEAVP